MHIPARHISENSDAFSSYWNPKTSQYFHSKLSKNISLKDADTFVSYYFQVDELGDAIAEEYLVKYGFAQGMGKIHQMIQSYPENLESYSENTQKFLNQIFSVPQWVNQDLIDAGCDFSNRTGTSGLATLRDYSLMGGYESSAINKPLIFTGALKKGAVKRLSDTVVFWVNVTGKNQLKLKGKGFYSVITTRLIHSFSRIMIEKNPEWKSELWGRPLNLWDMLATNLGFSIAYIDGLKKLGLHPTQKEIDGTLNLWKYVGYLIGIPEHLLVDTEQQAVDALFLWSKTQKGPDTDSVALAHSLYTEPKNVTFTNSTLLKNFVYKTNLGYNWEMLGNETCAKLQIPKTKAIYWVKMICSINSIVEKYAFSSENRYKKIVARGYKQQLEVRDLYHQEK
ncbi:oxygenase MpaB family protein [Flavobacterium sp. I3-2]|uniref:oxygenase MpaB family protein n=1 Tax=Flavobacterium sp. I3-2 TaxID=2748319 RepID=UPI0015AE3419|nr:oxygenase MpaB family protein [Flavobacterium sp. I3-2]